MGEAVVHHALLAALLERLARRLLPAFGFLYAGSARPGVILAVLNSDKKPDHLTTTFAGFDIEAVKKLREHLLPYPPSSPSIALFKDGQLVHFLERHNIEGASAEMIANNLTAAFEAYC